jgi:uncharacterized protein (DUF1330 family)
VTQNTTKNPTDEQIAKLIEDAQTKTGEVVMLNLLKYSAKAGDGEGGSGQDSYNRYGAKAIEKVQAAGGRVVWAGTPDQVLIGDNDANDWDAVLLVAYPNREAFITMTSDPDYQKGHASREGGLERMALVPMTPGQGFLALGD